MQGNRIFKEVKHSYTRRQCIICDKWYNALSHWVADSKGELKKVTETSCCDECLFQPDGNAKQ